MQRDAAGSWVALRFAQEAEAEVAAQIAEAELAVEATRAAIIHVLHGGLLTQSGGP